MFGNLFQNVSAAVKAYVDAAIAAALALIGGSPSTLYAAIDTYANILLLTPTLNVRARAVNGKGFDLIGNGTNWIKQPQADAVVAVASASGVVTIDLHDGYTQSELALTENVTSWVFSNLPPVGYFIERSIMITQHASSAKTVVSPASTGRTAGVAYVADTTLSSKQTLILRVHGDGTKVLYPTPVQV